MKSRARHSLLAAVVTLAAVGGVSQAFAAGSGSTYTTVKRTTSIAIDPEGGNTVGSVKATCPRGKRPALLGFALTPDHDARVLSSKTARRAGVARAANGSQDSSRSLTSYSYCRKTGTVRVRTHTKTLPGSQTVASVVATCPSGTRLLYGGFSLTQAGALAGLGRVGDRRWKVTVLAFTATRTTAIAYCSASAPRTTSRSKTFAVTGDDVTKTLRCARGSHAVGGGFLGDLTISDAYTLPVIQRLDGTRGWTTRFSDDNALFPAKATATVYCATNH